MQADDDTGKSDGDGDTIGETSNSLMFRSGMSAERCKIALLNEFRIAVSERT